MRRTTALVSLLGLIVAACTQATTDTTTGSDGPGTTTGDRPVIVGSAFETFASCDELLGYYIDHAVEIVGPWGLGGGFIAFDAVAAAESADNAGSGTGGSRTFTESNNQVAGVDEIDTVKTDGNRIYSLVDGVLRIATIGDPGITMAGTVRFDWWPQGLLLEGNTLLVVGQIWSDVIPLGAPDGRIAPQPSSALTRLVQVDVSDADRPRIVRTIDLDGSFVSARNVDGVARVAINSQPVGLAWATPQGGGLRAERAATEANRQIIRNSTLDNWLPYYVLSNADGTSSEGRLIDCANVMAPTTFSGIDTLSLLTFDLRSGIDSWSDAGVVASGATMYATADTTYLATQRWMNWAIMTESDVADAEDGFVTQIHKFDTSDAGAPRYVASGEVDGFLLNQFSMDEYNGDLRVASTTSPAGWWVSNESESLVTVLRQSGDVLEPIGVVAGLGQTEQIYAVRFIEDAAYVVTFRQTDPLYVVDLSDPAAPVVAGELKIPGYSAYLHPVGDGRLLGIGQDADDTGRVQGTQLSLFDVSDPTNPVRLSQVALGGGWSQAEGNHLAFTYLDGTALAPYEKWTWEATQSGKETSTFDTGVLVVRMEGDTLRLDGVLRTELESEVVLDSEADWSGFEPYLMVPQRTIVIDGYVYTVTNGGIAIHALDSLTRVTFQRF